MSKNFTLPFTNCDWVDGTKSLDVKWGKKSAFPYMIEMSALNQ